MIPSEEVWINIRIELRSTFKISDIRFYFLVLYLLFLRPNLTILNLVASTVLPIRPAICSSVLVG